MSANIRNDHAQHALKRTTHRLGLAIGGVTLIGFLMGWIGVLPLPQASIEWKMPRPEEESQYAPVGIGVAGEEVLMIYVGSSTCRWSNATELPGLVRKLKVDLQARVLESGYGFATLGISSDLSPVAGWRHLQAFGRFDEIVAGRGWLNTGLTRYVYGALPGQVLPLPQASIEWKMPRPEEESQYAPVGIGVAGEEVLMIYVGSSTCRWSNATELPGLVRKLKVDLQARVLESGYGFATLGISSDLSPVAGWRHLQAFGRFDEIVAGRGWLNTGLTRYVYGALPGQAATPQVILVQRRVTSERGNRAITHERVLLRRIGLDEIVDWVSAGAEVLLESPTGGTE